jgi:hypothetical protein
MISISGVCVSGRSFLDHMVLDELIAALRVESRPKPHSGLARSAKDKLAETCGQVQRVCSDPLRSSRCW